MLRLPTQAKYNPEGMSGIINIVLHKNANQGFNGSVNSGATAGHYVRYNTSTNMNYKTGKVNFFGNYGYNGGDNYNFGFVQREGINFQDFTFVNGRDAHLLKVGADLYLDDKNTLSLYTTQNWFENTGNGDVLEPEHGTMAIGSGGNYAYAAARALMDSDLSAEEIARKAMEIAGDICVYTNQSIVLETLETAD